MKKLTFEEAGDILVGCTILGTGGGGDLEKGLGLIREDFERGLEYRMLSMDEIKDGDLYACPYFCGSIGPEEARDRYHSYPRLDKLETVSAVEALERFFGEKLGGLVSIEYGGMNTAVAMSTAARLGRPFVDADAAGRAVPDLQFSTFYVHQKAIYPLAVASGIGDVAIFEKVADDFRAEDLVRAMAVVSGNSVGMADHPVRGAELRSSVIPDALSYAGSVGRAQRIANEEGRDPIRAIIDQAGGYMLFEGVMKEDTHWKNDAGFTIGTLEAEGLGNYRGKDLRIWFKNENVICWLDGEVVATVPDLICVLSSETGYPLTNPFYKKGMRVTVLGFKAPEVWRSNRGLSILNPGFFGFNVDYIPIENRL